MFIRASKMRDRLEALRTAVSINLVPKERMIVYFCRLFDVSRRLN